MDDLSVFRRFFVVSNLLQEVIGMITGREPVERTGNTSGITPGPNPFTADEAPINGSQTMGGSSPIQGTRPATPRRRRRREAPPLPNTARYGFPASDESV